MSLKAGTVLGGKYRLLEALGQGAMGSVWLAENELLSSRVAVKLLRADLASTDARHRFEREARGVASLDSPHVVRVFDVGETDEGQPFLVMEYLRGETLLDRIQSEGLTRDETTEVVTQIGRALTAAHDQGIVHRDLKPANVYVADAAGAPFVKVLDFGIAKHTRDDLALTDTGALMGTPYYMSPEQFISPRDIDHRADLWGLTVIAYACLLGRLPFEGETVGALSLAVHAGDFPAPTSVDASLPTAIDSFFARSLNPDPKARFDDAATLAAGFAEALVAAPPAQSSAPSAVAAPSTPEPEVPAFADKPTLLLETSAAQSDTTTPTSIERPVPVERRWWPAAVAILVVGGVGLGLSRGEQEGPAASATPASSAPPPPAEASSSVVVAPAPSSTPSTTTTASAPSPSMATAPELQPKVPAPRPRVAPATTSSPSVDSPKARSQW